MPELHERLVDLLLEEELGEDRAARVAARVAARAAERAWAGEAAGAAAGRPLPSGGRRLLAAALLLLGAGTVLATLLLQERPVDQKAPLAPPRPPPQDPAPEREAVAPRDLEHFLALLDQAVGMRMARHDMVGAVRFATGTGSSERLHTEAWPERLEIAGEELGRWRRALVASSAERAPSAGLGDLANVWFDLPDGRTVSCLVSSGRARRWHVGVGDPIVPDDRLAALVDAANRELALRHRLATGHVHSLAELERLGAGTRRVELPVALVRDGALTRCAALRELRIHADDAAPLAGAEVAALPGLGQLEELDVPAGTWGDEDLRALARDGALPRLQRLVLRSASTALTGRGFDAFAEGNLAAVELRDCPGIDAAGLRALAAGRRLRRLVLAGAQGDAADLLLGELPAFRALRELTVRSEAVTDRGLEVLPLTRIERLVLIDARVSGEGLAVLRGLPSLQELELVTDSLGDDDVPGLGGLDGLRRLALDHCHVSDDGLAALRRQLPGTAVELVPGRRLFDTATALGR